MLRKYSSFRSVKDNFKLGALTAFSAGMVNVISVIIFFAFTSNVTGHYAVLANEIARGNWYQAAVALLWILMFFIGNMVSNLIVIHGSGRMGHYLAHAMPIVLEIACIGFTGFYLHHFYQETLQETELLVGTMLFAMGLQNGLTASISNFAIKTTHLTGLTTDLGLLFSMFTKKEYRSDKNLVHRAQLLLYIVSAYMAGGIVAGLAFNWLQSFAFLVVCGVLCLVIAYDLYHSRLFRFRYRRQTYFRNYILESRPGLVKEELGYGKKEGIIQSQI